jgi:predicted nucleic acid-binding protein
MIVLDTNVLSALMRPELNARVVGWTDRQTAPLWTTVVSLIEIRSGLLLMPEGRRRDGLSEGFAHLLDGFLLGRVLPVDQEAAEEAARITAIRQKLGKKAQVGDYLIGGVVLSRRATLATRNVKDFAELGIALVDPWAA